MANKENMFVPPLAVHLIWGSKDYAYYSEGHEEYLDEMSKFVLKFRSFITRDPEKPFSRGLDIPTFLYCAEDPNELPDLKKMAAKDIVFFFVTRDMITEKWDKYICKLKKKFPNEKNKYNNKYIIPVVLDHKSLSFCKYKSMKNINFVRLDGLKNERIELKGIIKLLYELYKRVWSKVYKDKFSIGLFLSHTKNDKNGYAYANSIIKHINKLNMGRFFDIYDIQSGTTYNTVIEDNAKTLTFIAILSDQYSSRYWCQREIIVAKKNEVPILVVNCLEEYEDRIFPAAANLPCIRVPEAKVPKDKIRLQNANKNTKEEILSNNKNHKVKSIDTLRILISALVETIRYKYSKELLKYYKEMKWIGGYGKKSKLFKRPPELWELNNLNKKVKYAYYPEPPLYKKEVDWILSSLDKNRKIELCTPLWSENDSKLELRIGLSIANYLFLPRESKKNIKRKTVDIKKCEKHNQHIDELERFSQTLIRYLLARECTLIYGGDFQYNGYTKFILDEAYAVKDRIHNNGYSTLKNINNSMSKYSKIKYKNYIENYIAWPFYLEKETKEWCVNDPGIYEVKKVKPAIKTSVNKEKISGTCKRSRSLTKMRKKSIRDSDARVFAGGKVRGHSGMMPGILEEFIIAWREEKPIYLVGGLGGITQILCRGIINNKAPEEIMEKWQKSENDYVGNSNVRYKDLYNEIIESDGSSISYGTLNRIISNPNLLKNLSERSGLRKKEYERLMETQFIDEAIHLIFMGLERISNKYWR